MSLIPKAPAVYKPTQSRASAPPVYQPQVAPAQAKIAQSPPPVYRPGIVPHASLQRKAVQPGKLEQRPAPPVYKPAQSPNANIAMQLKPAQGSNVVAQAGKSIAKQIWSPTRHQFTPGLRPAATVRSIHTSSLIAGSPVMIQRHSPSFPAGTAAKQSSTVQRSIFASVWNAAVNYFYPPQPQPIVQPPPPPPVDPAQQRIKDNKRYFHEHGRPRYEERIDRYPNGMDKARWGALTYVHGKASNTKKRGRTSGSIHILVTELLSNFVHYGFGYDIMQGLSSDLMDSVLRKDSPNGNCLAYAKSFADILVSFGIEAEAQWVRGEQAGRFMVKLNNFIDAQVPGHIYEKGVLQAGYYVFTSHAATWVEATQRYYDPMSTISYASLDPYIECELDSDKNQIVFTPSSQPKTLQKPYKWKLIKRQQMLAGGFARLDMVPLKKGK